MNAKNPFLALSLSAALVAFGEAQTLNYDVEAAGPWAEADSWLEKAAPAEGDVLVFGGDATLKDSDAAAAALAAQITIGEGARLVVSNESTVTLNGYVSGAGSLVKLGAGALEYTRVPATKEEARPAYKLSGGTVISNGVVRFAPNANDFEYDLGPLAVYAPGVFDVNGVKDPRFNIISVTGDGTITNSAYTSDNWTQLRFTGAASVFDGLLAGDGIRVHMNGDVTFNNLGSTIGYTQFAAWGGTMRFPSFGMMGQPSPCGPRAVVTLRDAGGKILYVGEGETTDRKFSLSCGNSKTIAVFDAGENGGVTLNGQITVAGADYWNYVRLAGDNAWPMVVAGPFVEESGTGAYYDKCGSGTWHFKDTASNLANRKIGGAFSVSGGTLRFDSIANVGQPCALGPQNARISSTNARSDRTANLDYCFSLSGGGTLEYAGVFGTSTDRGVAVAGSGRILNSSGGALLWNGQVRSGGDASVPSILTLDGDGELASALMNVHDTPDVPLSLVKDGAGTWALGTNAVFSGSLEVKRGRLMLGVPERRFTWFKWVIREISSGRDKRNGGTSGNGNVGARQFVFYDAEGHDLSTGKFTEDFSCNVANLQPGYVTYDESVNAIASRYTTGNEGWDKENPDRNLNKLFDGRTSEWLVAARSNPQRLDVPSSYVSVVFRMPLDSPQVAAYDFVGYAGGGRSIVDWEMYGSEDGAVWYLVDSRTLPDDAKAVSGGGNGFWASDDTAFVSGATRSLASGCTFPATLDVGEPEPFVALKASSVYVAEGAALSAVVDGSPFPSTIALENGKAQGAYEGFVVPEEGAFDLRLPMPWLRVTVTETKEGRKRRTDSTDGSDDGNVQMHEFAVYDAAGRRLNAGLQVDSRNDPSLLQPGYVSYARNDVNFYPTQNPDRNVDKLFDGENSGNGWCITVNVPGHNYMRADDPESWAPFTMRLADGAGVAVGYDWCVHGDSTYKRTAVSWKIEGSPDGENWVTLDEQTDYDLTHTAKGGRWFSDDSEFSANAERTGIPFSISASELRRAVDLDNFSMAADLSKCTKLENFRKWKVRINGVEVPNVRIRYADGCFAPMRRGTVVVIK